MRIPSLLLSLPLLMQAFPSDGPGDWPAFRGPDSDGMARGDAPLHWSDTEHIKWKAEIPGRGHSSPVIWGDKVFVTTAVIYWVITAAFAHVMHRIERAAGVAQGAHLARTSLADKYLQIGARRSA